MGNGPDVMVMTFGVRISDMDVGGRLLPTAVARYFQEAAATHATLWGFGTEGLEKTGMFWVMHRVAMQFERLPGWRPGLELTLTTWSRGLEKLQAFRDFELADAAGAVVATGTSAWLVLDLATRRPHRLNVKDDNFPHFPERHAMDAGVLREAVPAVGEAAAAATRTVRYLDLDMNGHVNNARYLDWVLDAQPAAFWRKHRATRLVANFLAEVNEGETIDVVGDETRETWAVRSAGRDACRVRLGTKVDDM